MLLLWVVLLAVFLWMFFPMSQGRRFVAYEKRVHVYSGLDETTWKEFLLNMKIFEFHLGTASIDKAAAGLYAAIENIRNLGLFVERADDSNYAEELQAIAAELGYEGEYMLNQNAMARGLYFFPKYLNETTKDYEEDVPPDKFPRRRGDQ